ncbi:MAG: PLP-dependent aminotransferase family protein [Dyadobacter sp.]|uniref:aminotransferase-like domain-containing protein n=1 Tax=Dyadobacter sp. TaxID=1914288 RepID=UPI001B056CFE|nr:PLP-dependent aminotransferase family protein [Dyadobacter sp.]MBO9616247.1 PLP-dependent aminotransferase family protein [Dyadobacter sp.]
MAKEILYLKIAKILEEQILSETLRIGDKLPSIRTIQKIYGVSLNTAVQAFAELESKSLIESRPKSGYFVSKTSQRKLALPSVSTLKSPEKGKNTDDLISSVFDILRDKSIRQFSLGIPDSKLLPLAKLNKGVIKAMRQLEGNGTEFEATQGSVNLKRNIAKWSLVLDGKLTEDDVVTTTGTTNAIYQCLLATTRPGDTIATESPVYFGILQLAKSMGLNVIELPTHPLTGVEIDALKKVIHKINVCCFTANFSNPLGSLMPDENKQALVGLLTDHNIPLIEDDLFGNLFFSGTRPKPCKVFDEAGLVMWCGGVSKTLAPGYRVGWVAPGRFKDKIIRQKLVQTVTLPSLFQEVIADFMEFGGYDHHLRTLRHTLHTNCLRFQRAIEDYFPENTKISQPQGGFFLWLELDKGVDTTELYETALKHKLSFAPGGMFSQNSNFNNCMRLNFALPWDGSLEQDIKRLGNLVKQAF